MFKLFEMFPDEASARVYLESRALTASHARNVSAERAWKKWTECGGARGSVEVLFSV